jgi:glutamyl/glutaminyl-tRNA synthetase
MRIGMPTPADWRAHLAERLQPLAAAGRWRTRFAPAPTGYLHLGHLVNAMHVWGVARAHGGEVLLRIEDHDRTRCRPEYETALLDDLDWLGLEPDLFATSSFRTDVRAHPARQSSNEARYAEALAHLAAAGAVYPCRCTRRDLAHRVPHAAGEEPRYDGYCAHGNVPVSETFARRVRLPHVVMAFDDLRLGALTQTPARQCSDVLVRDRHAQYTYQFAVVVDDMVHDIDLIIRGEDLLASTGRQLQLAAMLGRRTPPQLLHHTLLVHADGSKLSKATHDTALREMRAEGWSPAALFGEAARRAGLTGARTVSAQDLPSLFA